MADEMVLIYATGASSDMRAAMFDILRANLAADIDIGDSSSMTINEKGKEKISPVGSWFAIVTTRQNVATVFDQLRGIERIRAYVIPVFATLP